MELKIEEPRVDENGEEGVDLEIVDIALTIRRELVESSVGAARLIVEGDVQSVDLAFVILTQTLGISEDEVREALEKGHEAQKLG